MAAKASKSKPIPNIARFTTKPPKRYNQGLFLDLNFGAIDSRTRLGRAQKALWKYLREYVEEPNIITELLTSRIVYKSLKLYLFEAADIKNTEISDIPNMYMSMANSLRRDLAALANFAGQASAPDLMEYLKSNYGKTKS